MSFTVGDKVQWTHTYRLGRSICMTTWEGKVAEVDTKGRILLLRRKKYYRVPAEAVRPIGQQSALTDAVKNQMGAEKTTWCCAVDEKPTPKCNEILASNPRDAADRFAQLGYLRDREGEEDLTFIAMNENGQCWRMDAE